MHQSLVSWGYREVLEDMVFVRGGLIGGGGSVCTEDVS